jgi:hypothetical protein
VVRRNAEVDGVVVEKDPEEPDPVVALPAAADHTFERHASRVAPGDPCHAYNRSRSAKRTP